MKHPNPPGEEIMPEKQIPIRQHLAMNPPTGPAAPNLEQLPAKYHQPTAGAPPWTEPDDAEVPPANEPPCPLVDPFTQPATYQEGHSGVDPVAPINLPVGHPGAWLPPAEPLEVPESVKLARQAQQYVKEPIQPVIDARNLRPQRVENDLQCAGELVQPGHPVHDTGTLNDRREPVAPEEEIDLSPAPNEAPDVPFGKSEGRKFVSTPNESPNVYAKVIKASAEDAEAIKAAPDGGVIPGPEAVRSEESDGMIDAIEAVEPALIEEALGSESPINGAIEAEEKAYGPERHCEEMPDTAALPEFAERKVPVYAPPSPELQAFFQFQKDYPASRTLHKKLHGARVRAGLTTKQAAIRIGRNREEWELMENCMGPMDSAYKSAAAKHPAVKTYFEEVAEVVGLTLEELLG